MERLQAFRSFYAELLTANVGAGGNTALKAAFASTPRERFVGAGPWKMLTRTGYLTTPNDDPALLYQDLGVALAEERQINNGQPMLHAASLAALQPKEGETAVHIGAGTGYYTAVLARLVGPAGCVFAYEIEPDLAERARSNLSDMPHVTVHSRSGTVGPLPASDLVYVNAAATSPLSLWLECLRAGGRLLFPLTPEDNAGRAAAGGMLLVTKLWENRWGARFVAPVAFIGCSGGRDPQEAAKLTAAFARGDFAKVQSLWLDNQPDESCWCAGNGWWLSLRPTTPVAAHAMAVTTRIT